MTVKKLIGICVLGVALFIGLIIGLKSFTTIPAGYGGVATVFGNVQDKSYTQGFHLKNPLAKIHKYDARQKTVKARVNVPSQDQLTTSMEASIQYRVNVTMLPNILQETGSVEELIEVHLNPNFRSRFREEGKNVEKAEHYFKDTVQATMQSNVTEYLQGILGPKGLIIESVLIREIRLPDFILKAIEAKKEREQQAEAQKAELERFETEQQQLIKTAQAQKDSADIQAETKKVLADADAYEIERKGAAITKNPAIIQLEAIEALKSMAKDPAAKMYFLDGKSTMPLPLLHMGQGK